MVIVQQLWGKTQFLRVQLEDRPVVLWFLIFFDDAGLRLLYFAFKLAPRVLIGITCNSLIHREQLKSEDCLGTYNVDPPVISWFISPSNYRYINIISPRNHTYWGVINQLSYKYHKP